MVAHKASSMERNEQLIISFHNIFNHQIDTGIKSTQEALFAWLKSPRSKE